MEVVAGAGIIGAAAVVAEEAGGEPTKLRAKAAETEAATSAAAATYATLARELEAGLI